MAEVLLFHHIQGLTEGIAAFGDELRAAGHTVHTPDLFEGRTFDSIEEGFSFVQASGETLDEKGFEQRRCAAGGTRVRRLLLGSRCGAAAGPDAVRGSRSSVVRG